MRNLTLEAIVPVTHDIPFLDELPGLAGRLSRVKVLYTDLDGTLLGRGASLLRDGEGNPTLVTAEAIVALNSAKATVVMTSGRNARQLREASRLMGWDDFIGELGCVRSRDRGARLTFETGDWPEGALMNGETPYEAILRVGALELLQERFPGRIEHHAPWHLDREATHVLRGNIPAVEAQGVLDGLPLPVTFVDNGVIHPPRHTLVGVDEVHAIHLVPTGSSKQRAIAADLAERGLGREEAMAIGDSAADVDMAQAVGLMVCVRNGLDDAVLRERARGRDDVCATRGSHGAGWAELATAWLRATEA